MFVYFEHAPVDVWRDLLFFFSPSSRLSLAVTGWPDVRAAVGVAGGVGVGGGIPFSRLWGWGGVCWGLCAGWGDVSCGRSDRTQRRHQPARSAFQSPAAGPRGVCHAQGHRAHQLRCTSCQDFPINDSFILQSISVPWPTGYLLITTCMTWLSQPVIKTRPYSVLCCKRICLVTVCLYEFIPHPEEPMKLLITVNIKFNPRMCFTHRICICYANTGSRMLWILNTPKTSSLHLTYLCTC